MTGFRTVRGFEDVWRPPVGLRRPRPEAAQPGRRAGEEIRARLARLVARAPEVMVKVTGRTRDPAHLAAHLSYVTRNGELRARTGDGAELFGRREVLDLADGWAATDLLDSRRRADTPMSISVILSMPARTDPVRLEAAAAAFAEGVFGGVHDYVLVLHTDTDHPHVHLAVRARGEAGQRLNPRKADLAAWRERFAEELRSRGVEAEATPRRARGITRKSERTPLRKLRERYESGRGAMSRRQRSAYAEAARLLAGSVAAEAWDRAIQARQQRIRRLYLAQARLLQASDDAGERRLGRDVERFLQEMPAPDTERLALARRLRGLGARAQVRDERQR